MQTQLFTDASEIACCRQAFEAEKQAFDELRAVAAAQHDKMNKTIRAREEALARLDVSKAYCVHTRNRPCRQNQG